MDFNVDSDDLKTSVGICDCHVHVFEKPDKYPFEIVPSYEPPFSPLPILRDTALKAGIERSVIVQPTPYGRDLSLLTATLQQLGDRAKGIGVASASASVDDLAAMKKAGIRGLRFVESHLSDGSRMPGTVPVDVLLQDLAPKLAELNMHAELWAPLPTILSQWSRIEACRIPVVLDHMGGFDASLGVEHPDFQRLLNLVRNRQVWIKLAICRRALGDPLFKAVRPFHDALINAAESQLVWASDFPFVRYPPKQVDMKSLLSLFRSWVNDAAIEQRILVDNPTNLYWRGGDGSLS